MYVFKCIFVFICVFIYIYIVQVYSDIMVGLRSRWIYVVENF